MSEIKLQVGKTYRNRKGKKVTIVEYDGDSEYPYRYKGSDGEWYAENGRFAYTESPKDLIEEVPETRHTFKIPEGVKKVTVEQVGNRIVVEMVPGKEPKPGDAMIDAKGNVYIFKSVFKSVVDSDIHKHFAWFGKDGRLVIGSMCTPGRPATPEEAQPLWDALKKAGKRWNAETMEVEEIPEFDRILEWVEANIKDGYYNHEDVAEAIEAYLKHREGEK